MNKQDRERVEGRRKHHNEGLKTVRDKEGHIKSCDWCLFLALIDKQDKVVEAAKVSKNVSIKGCACMGCHAEANLVKALKDLDGE